MDGPDDWPSVYGCPLPVTAGALAGLGAAGLAGAGASTHITTFLFAAAVSTRPPFLHISPPVESHIFAPHVKAASMKER